MAWLYWRNGIAYVGWRDVGHKLHGRSLRTRNKRVAVTRFSKFKRELPEDEAAHSPRLPKTLGEALPLYLDAALARMRHVPQQRLRGRLKPALGSLKDRSLNSITPIEFEDYRDRRLRGHTRRGARRSPSTVAGELKEWRTFFNWCIRRGWLAENPASIRFPRVPRNIPRFIEAKDIPGYLERAKEVSPLLHAALVTALYAGLRRGELVSLEWKDVDFKTGLLYVRNKPEHPLKDYEERTIGLHEKLAEVLRKLPRRSQWCFPSPDGVCWDVDNFSKLQQRARVPGFHAWRHTFASYLAMGGADVVTIKKLMGHSSVSTTERYMHVSPAHQAQAVSLLQFPE